MRIARRIRTGFFMINAAPVGFDGPFGGYTSPAVVQAPKAKPHPVPAIER